MKKYLLCTFIMTSILQGMEYENLDVYWHKLCPALTDEKHKFDLAMSFLGQNINENILSTLHQKIDDHLNHKKSEILSRIHDEGFVLGKIDDLLQVKEAWAKKYRDELEEEYSEVNACYNTVESMLRPSIDRIHSFANSHPQTITSALPENQKEQDTESLLSIYDIKATFDQVHRNISDKNVIWKDILSNIDIPSTSFDPRKLIVKRILSSCVLHLCNHFDLYKQEYRNDKKTIDNVMMEYNDRYEYYLEKLMACDETLIKNYEVVRWPYHYIFTKQILDEAQKRVSQAKRPSILPMETDPVFIFYPELKQDFDKVNKS